MSSSKVKFVVHQTHNGEWTWKLVNRGQVIAVAARNWGNKSQARRGAEASANHAANAPVTVDE